MSTKINRALRGPSWAEVILGAILSLVLGVVLGAALLIARPVVAVKAPPKEEERDARAVYYVQGARDPSKARAAQAKRESFAQGQSVTVTEEELNALATVPPPAPGAAPAKPGEAPASSPADTIAPGPLNFRLRDGVFQVSVPVTLNLLGLSPKFIVQSRGTFVKRSNGHVFEPEALYVGSLPLQRLPFAADYVQDKLLAGGTVPEDIRASWAKLAAVTIEGNALKLAMP
jgi:hypothetical protein